MIQPQIFYMYFLIRVYMVVVLIVYGVWIYSGKIMLPVQTMGKMRRDINKIKYGIYIKNGKKINIYLFSYFCMLC